ncbi:MAG: CDP-glycerol glycerophosphotransferase family protein [Chlamydiota bacterium]|nr:CDP-glycerol glycerophosphotransferase family protein [Chlamydiota bacterium]
MQEKKCVALNYASHSHYNDHLVPVCAIMNMPLIVVDENDCATCKKYYPDVDVILAEYDEFNPEYLIQNFDVLFMSDLWDRDVFKEKFQPLEKKYHKNIRNVHVPHGYSDKGFYLRKAAREDITLIYGQNMLDMFRHEGVLHELQHYVITGNYRLTYYRTHQTFFDKIVQEEVLSKFDKKRKTILYAPTWMDLEETSTYFDFIGHVLDTIPEDYNIIVKPHPQLELDDTALYYQILGKYQDHPQVHFLIDFHLIFPILNVSDIYIGDMSSIGYDFLHFNRPMFFLNKDNRNPKRDRRSFLYNCGVDIKKHQFPRLYEIIGEHLHDDKKYKNIRAEVYEYTFGKERTFSEIKTEIINTYNEIS